MSNTPFSVHFPLWPPLLQLMPLPFQQKRMENPSSVTYSSTEKPLELLRGDCYISQGQARINVNLDLHPSQKYPCSHCFLITPPFLHLTCPTNQKHKSLIEPCFLPILNPSVKLLENQLNSVAPFLYEVIDLDSKPVKVSLDFDEKYLPFYCNLLTRPDFPLCALAWVLKSHKIDWDRYLSREEGGKSFSSPFTL